MSYNESIDGLRDRIQLNTNNENESEGGNINKRKLI
jgi:hypothetical protein